jgi:prolyl oligopeptidase
MSRFEYPDAERLEIVERLHGRPVADPYRWLEDPADPRTVAWEAAQDALLARERESWPLRERFVERLEALMASGDVSPPSWRGERQFFLRRLPDQEHAVYVTVDPDGTERVLIDPTALDASGTTTLDGTFPSKEGDLLAYLLSEGGTEESALYVIDVATGERIEGPSHGPATPPSPGCRAGSPTTTCDGSRRTRSRRASPATTAASSCTRWAPIRTRIAWSSARSSR